MTIRRAFRWALLCPVLIAALGSIGCGRSSSNNQTQAPAAAQPAPGAQSGSPTQPPAPDVTAADTNVDVGQVRINLSVGQRPIAAGEKNRFCVRTEIDGIPFDLSKGQISFTMDAPAGDQRYPLSESEGCYVADVVLPASSSGSARWYATVEGVVDEQPVSARFQFDVAKPATAQ